jgi:hypothetical protein
LNGILDLLGKLCFYAFLISEVFFFPFFHQIVSNFALSWVRGAHFLEVALIDNILGGHSSINEKVDLITSIVILSIWVITIGKFTLLEDRNNRDETGLLLFSFEVFNFRSYRTHILKLELRSSLLRCFRILCLRGCGCWGTKAWVKAVVVSFICRLWPLDLDGDQLKQTVRFGPLTVQQEHEVGWKLTCWGHLPHEINQLGSLFTEGERVDLLETSLKFNRFGAIFDDFGLLLVELNEVDLPEMLGSGDISLGLGRVFLNQFGLCKEQEPV